MFAPVQYSKFGSVRLKGGLLKKPVLIEEAKVMEAGRVFAKVKKETKWFSELVMF